MIDNAETLHTPVQDSPSTTSDYTSPSHTREHTHTHTHTHPRAPRPTEGGALADSGRPGSETRPSGVYNRSNPPRLELRMWCSPRH